uniref:FH2 domain-containing protein n=1 Tax=Nelumbo nucifera TaxID=4432 RepID=A0A822ZBT5_NELNU|nr:TPA_asm: hypothetical protein HUJ06_013321 [Nelumbo nucifera]
MKSSEEDSGFRRTVKSFVEHAEKDITRLLEEEKRIMTLVKSTADYFHGHAGKDEGLRLFVIVRDFLIIILEKVCKEVKESPKMPTKTPSMCNLLLIPVNRLLHQNHHLTSRRKDNSSSDEET